MQKIFLSYSKSNLPAAKVLTERLELDGYSVWWDHELAAGEEYDTTIEAELKSADKVIVLWSHASVGSRWVRSEADHAAQQNKLVPVRIEQVEVPVAFRLFHFVSMSSLGGGILEGSEYASLLKAMRKGEMETAGIKHVTGTSTSTNVQTDSKWGAFTFAIAVSITILVALFLLFRVWTNVI